MENHHWSWVHEGWKEVVVVVTVAAGWFLFSMLADANVMAALSAPLPIVAAPATQFVYLVKTPLRPISHWFKQSERIAALNSQLLESQTKLANLEKVEAENAQLRSMLENRHLLLRKRRIGQPIASYALPSVWVGEGSDVGAGSLLFYRDVLLGRITTVNGAIASVDLLTQPSGFKVLIKTEGGHNGVTGVRNGRLVIENLPPEALVKQGEKILTLGQPGVEPNVFVGVAESDVLLESGRPVVYVDQLTSFFETPLVEVRPL